MTGKRQGQGESTTSLKRLDAVERQARALELRKEGKGFAEIAQALGYGGPAGAYKAVTTALRKTLQEPADELRRMELERLDALHAALWPQALAGKWLAVDRVLSVMERRAKLLGLDAPTRSDVVTQMKVGFSADDFAAAERELADWQGAH